jgi:hypothetical protein
MIRSYEEKLRQEVMRRSYGGPNVLSAVLLIEQ